MPKQWAQKLLEVFFSKCNTNPLMTSSVITCSHMHIALYLQFNTTAVSGQLLYAGQLLRVLSWITDDCSAIWPSLFFYFLILFSECPYGTYGMECRKTCNCPSGICDRVTGKCLKFPFFQLSASKPPNRRKIISHTGKTWWGRRF